MDVTAALLDQPTYLYSEVDRLVNLHAGTARRWINGYSRSGKHYDPILRLEPSDTEWVTWGEFVEVRMLAEFRDRDVPAQRLRAAVEQLRREFGVQYPLAHRQPYLHVFGGELILNDPAGQMVLRTGQGILDASRALMDAATLAGNRLSEVFVAELQPDFDFPGIKINPERMSGQPTFEGRRVAVATIAGLVAGGDPVEAIAADYNLSVNQVGAAVRYARKYDLALAA